MSKIREFFKNRAKRTKFFSISFASFMFATTLGGSAGICYATSKKIEYGSEFEKSYNIRFELDPYANEDPNQDATNVSLDEVKEKLNQAVDSYSYYLDQKGIEVSDIYPEVYETTEGTTSTVHAYINAVVPNIKVTDKDDDKEKIDMSPAEVYFSDIYSPRLSIFYHADKNADYVINKDYLVNDDDDIMLPSNSYDNAIYINLTTHKIEDFNGAKEIKENFKDSVPKDDNNKTITQEQPYMYIVNDQEGFINRLNYLLSVYRAGAGAIDTRFGTIQPYLDICNKFLSESELTFCKDYYDFYGFSPLSEALQLNNADIVYSGAGAYSNKKTGGTILDSGSIFTDINKQGTNEYVNFIEDITTEKTSDNQTYVVHKGTLKYSFMSKWIVGIVTNGYSGSSSNTASSSVYTDFFPDKDPTSTSKDSNDRWLVIKNPTDSIFDTRLLKNGFAKNCFPYPVKNMSVNKTTHQSSAEWVGSLTGKDPRFDTDIKGPTDVNEFDSVIKHNIFKTSAVLSMFIALIVIALMIGLIVTLLYKIPGMMAFGLSVLVGSITTLGLFSAGFQLSVGMIAGLIAVLFLTLFTTVNFFERLKKQIAQTYDMNVAIRRGFLSSILSCLDLHIIFLLLGIVLVYFGPSSLVSSGVALVIGCLLSLALSFFALVGCVWLMFFRQPMINSFNLFTYKRDKLVQKFEDESTKVENLNKMTFFSNTTAKEKSKFGFINKLTHNTQIFGWRSIVYSCVAAALAIVGLVLIFTIGIHSSYSFFGGTRIVAYIDDPTKLNFNEFLNNLKSIDSSISWYNCTLDGHYVYLYTSSTLALPDVKTWDIWLNSGFSLDNVLVQEIDATPINNFVLTDIKLMFIATGFICAYGLIRLGWTNLIGLFVGLVVGPLLTIAFISVCQIPFDTYIIQASILVYGINALFVFNVLGNIVNPWVKNVPKDFASIKKAINEQINNLTKYYYILVPILLICMVAFGLLAPTTISCISYITIIGIIASSLVSFTFAPMISGYFLLIKHKYLKNVTPLKILNKNYDDIDEETIPGVNQVSKEKTYL